MLPLPVVSKSTITASPVTQSSSNEPLLPMPIVSPGNNDNLQVFAINMPESSIQKERALLIRHDLVPGVESMSNEQVHVAHARNAVKLVNSNLKQLPFQVYDHLWENQMAPGYLIHSYSNLVARYDPSILIFQTGERGELDKCYFGKSWGAVNVPDTIPDGIRSILVPLCFSNHWILIYLDLDTNRLNVWDSLRIYNGNGRGFVF
jgi:hypothetical protein